MTVHEFITWVENARHSYEDEIVFARPMIGRETQMFRPVDYYHDEGSGIEGEGKLILLLSSAR